jgi:hypothetical protein
VAGKPCRQLRWRWCSRLGWPMVCRGVAVGANGNPFPLVADSLSPFGRIPSGAHRLVASLLVVYGPGEVVSAAAVEREP